MNIAGWHKCSFVDYPGKVAATIFTPGCNMRCSYCLYRSFLVERPVENMLPVESVLAFLKKRAGIIQAVVVTGGEPTLQQGLESFLRCVKDLGFLTKLDTNGANPGKLAAILNAELVDYVALDLKAPKGKFTQITGTELKPETISLSRDLIERSGVDYELRTTVAPALDFEDIIEIAKTIRGAKRYALQQYRKPLDSSTCEDPNLNLAPHPASFFFSLRETIQDWFEELIIRDVDLTAGHHKPAVGIHFNNNGTHLHRAINQ